MSFVAEIFGARSAAKGQQRAADAASSASAASLAEQRRQYDLSRSDMQPWLTAGGGAIGQLSRLYGLSSAAPTGQPQTQPPMGGGSVGGPGTSGSVISNMFGGRFGGAENQALDAQGYQMPQAQGGMGQPQTQPLATGAPAGTAPAGGGQYDTFWQSPDYNFRLDESMRALTARNAALGIQDSGAAQRSALTLAGNQASGEYNNYANRLAALAGVGQTAAQNNAVLGGNYANAVTGINQNTSQALGSSYINQGNIWANLANSFNGQATRAASAFMGGGF